MTITIIGSGKVGAAVALNCALRELDDILLLDIVKGFLKAKHWILTISVLERGIDCKVSGSKNNYEDIKGSDFVVVVVELGENQA